MQPLLLLHGAIGAADQLQPLATSLQAHSKTISFDFPGHGGKAFAGQSFSIAGFAEAVKTFLEEQELEQVNIFGYSMGGYVGMYLAKHYPQKVSKLVTLATKFHWDEAIAAKEIKMLDAAKIEEKLPAFAKALQQRHAPNDWKQVLQHTIGMLLALGADNTLKPEQYADIQTPSLILLGDRDKMVSLEETVAVYRSLPNAQMGIIPNTHHPIEQVNLEALSFLIKQFLQ